jgi:Holliday junction resolvasome RuvABC endonuclease subunit
MTLALDFGTVCGWAKTTAAGRIVFHHFTTNPDPKTDFKARRYRLFRDHLAELLVDDIDTVYYEDVRGHTSTAAAHWWGGWEALTLLACDSRELPCHGVHTGTLKKWATGAGNAPKVAMMDAARRYVGNVEITHDEADAVCLLAYAIEQRLPMAG